MTRSLAFEQAVSKVLRHEGGYVNHPSDPGGETNMGITKRSYPNVDIRNLTLEQAKDIYFNDFWKTGPYDRLTYPTIAAKMFDTAVNVGPGRAYSLLQGALNSLGAKLVVDGIIGRNTLGAMSQYRETQILKAYREAQANYYRAIVRRRPASSVFLKGWLRRAAS